MIFYNTVGKKHSVTDLFPFHPNPAADQLTYVYLSLEFPHQTKKEKKNNNCYFGVWSLFSVFSLSASGSWQKWRNGERGGRIAIPPPPPRCSAIRNDEAVALGYASSTAHCRTEPPSRSPLFLTPVSPILQHYLLTCTHIQLSQPPTQKPPTKLPVPVPEPSRGGKVIPPPGSS